jgi:tRNA-specific 2-thiouridylase
MEKHEVREIATAEGFINHAKKDSTGICFIGERKFRDFLNRFIPAQPGNIVTDSGEMIGQHSGLMFYTLGQRQGLGIGGVKNASEAPWFVAQKNLQTNELVVVQGHDHPLMQSHTLQASQLNWISGKAPESPLRCTAKIRYRQPDQACIVELGPDGHCQVTFDAPQRAITPGQALVLYQGEECLAGAVID